MLVLTPCVYKKSSVYSPSCALRVSLTFGGFIDGAWVDGLRGDKRHEAGHEKGNERVEGMHYDLLRGSLGGWYSFESLSVSAVHTIECPSGVVKSVCKEAN